MPRKPSDDFDQSKYINEWAKEKNANINGKNIHCLQERIFRMLCDVCFDFFFMFFQNFYFILS